MTEDTNHAFKVKVFVSVFIYEKLQINVSISFTLRKKNDLAQRCVQGVGLDARGASDIFGNNQ
jgi:hypothetical protein